AFDIVSQFTGCDFPDALRELAKRLGCEAELGDGDGSRRHFLPPQRPTADPEDVPAARREVMRAIWSIVESSPPTDEAARWLDGRGIAPVAAHDTGCRDWWPVLAE